MLTNSFYKGEYTHRNECGGKTLHPLQENRTAGKNAGRSEKLQRRQQRPNNNKKTQEYTTALVREERKSTIKTLTLCSVAAKKKKRCQKSKRRDRQYRRHW